MLDPLVDREDRNVARPCESSGVEEESEVPENLWVAIGLTEDPIDEVRTGELELVLRDAGSFVVEKRFGVVAQQCVDVHEVSFGGVVHP